MPLCKHCNKLIKPLGMPVCLVEQMDVYLTKIIDDVNYEMSDNYYRHPAHYPVPVVPLVVEFVRENDRRWHDGDLTIVVWKAPCIRTKTWTYHAGEQP